METECKHEENCSRRWQEIRKNAQLVVDSFPVAGGDRNIDQRRLKCFLFLLFLLFRSMGEMMSLTGAT
jgi:hypothetical protein